ncbi:MAG: methionyl-tRNA formyltransferase, partial [Gammaproteobacteria bacterium]
RPDPLKEFAVEKGLPVMQPASYKKPEVWEQMKSLAPDLGVMAYVTLFVPEEALNVPTHGTIQYHPSLLPDHKGPSAINWPIIFGKKKTGLSIFWPDNGLDTGPILLQKEVEVGPDDTLGSVYFDKLYPLGVKAMLEGVDLVRDGTAPKIPQDPNAGSYESWCRKDDVQIDWSKPVDEVYNLIRGANPAPGAWALHDGAELQIFDCARLDVAAGAPGEVTAVDDTGFTVSASGGQIQVMRVRPQGANKIPAAEFAAQIGISPGVRLG